MKHACAASMLALTLGCALPSWGGATPAANMSAPDTIKPSDTEADGGGSDAQAWRNTSTFETWLYATRTTIRNDSVLNPGNAIAGLASTSGLFDGRFNLRAEQGPWLLVLNPRWVGQRNEVNTHSEQKPYVAGSGRLGQGFMRFSQNDTTITLGRELFTWGPASFRSPSSPFYFDAGRTNPLAATPGIDLVRATQRFGAYRVTSAYVFSTKQVLPAEDLGRSVVLKMDRQGSNHLSSLVVSQQVGGAPFVGGFSQFTLNDAWLLYGEFGSQRLPYALTPNQAGVPGPFYSLQQPAARSTTSLIGVNYTLESGQALIAEYLHNDSGYSNTQSVAYFQQAIGAGNLAKVMPSMGLPALGQALGQQPRLLGRNYLWLNGQSNPQDPGLLWRVGWTQSLTDRSGQALVYLEKNFVPTFSAFASLTAIRGNVQTEYGALWHGTLTLGIKWFVF